MTNPMPDKSDWLDEIVERDCYHVKDADGRITANILTDAAVASIQKHIDEAVAGALREERVATLGMSNDAKIRRALYLAEKQGYDRCVEDYKRRETQRLSMPITPQKIVIDNTKPIDCTVQPNQPKPGRVAQEDL